MRDEPAGIGQNVPVTLVLLRLGRVIDSPFFSFSFYSASFFSLDHFLLRCLLFFFISVTLGDCGTIIENDCLSPDRGQTSNPLVSWPRI